MEPAVLEGPASPTRPREPKNAPKKRGGASTPAPTITGSEFMKIKRLAFLCLSVIALSALSAAASGAQPGSEMNLRQLHQVRSALHQPRGGTQPLALQNSSLSATANAAAPSLTPLTNQLPDGISFTLLLTDGTVMAQDGFYPYMWWKLTPDINGSYLNGTWSQLSSLPETYSPSAASEAVLADGRVLLIGGEYSNYTLGEPFTLTNQGAISDPRP